MTESDSRQLSAVLDATGALVEAAAGPDLNEAVWGQRVAQVVQRARRSPAAEAICARWAHMLMLLDPDAAPLSDADGDAAVEEAAARIVRPDRHWGADRPVDPDPDERRLMDVLAAAASGRRSRVRVRDAVARLDPQARASLLTGLATRLATAMAPGVNAEEVALADAAAAGDATAFAFHASGLDPARLAQVAQGWVLLVAPGCADASDAVPGNGLLAGLLAATLANAPMELFAARDTLLLVLTTPEVVAGPGPRAGIVEQLFLLGRAVHDLRTGVGLGMLHAAHCALAPPGSGAGQLLFRQAARVLAAEAAGRPDLAQQALAAIRAVYGDRAGNAAAALRIMWNELADTALSDPDASDTDIDTTVSLRRAARRLSSRR